MEASSEQSNLIDQLIKSIDQSNPKEKDEVDMIDRFIGHHASIYKLPDERYDSLLNKILLNRINNAAWQYE